MPSLCISMSYMGLMIARFRDSFLVPWHLIIFWKFWTSRMKTMSKLVIGCSWPCQRWVDKANSGCDVMTANMAFTMRFIHANVCPTLVLWDMNKSRPAILEETAKLTEKWNQSYIKDFGVEEED